MAPKCSDKQMMTSVLIVDPPGVVHVMGAIALCSAWDW